MKIILLGGTEKVGNNCVLYESGENSLVVDCGLDPAVLAKSQIIVPPPRMDILDNRLRAGKFVFAFITHGHLDHCGAVGELLARGIPICTSNMTSKFLYRYEKNLNLKLDDLRKVPWQIIKEAKYPIFNRGSFRYYVIPQNHSIPGAFGVSMFAEGKKVVHLSDFKFHGYRSGSAWFEKILAKIAGSTGVDCLVLDVLNSDLPGFTPCEEEVVKNLREIILQTQGKVFIATISSNLQRIEESVKMISALGKKYAFLGLSMKESYKMLWRRLSGFGRQTRDYNAADVIFSGGTQGEINSGLRQVAEGGKSYFLNKEEYSLELGPRDVAIIAGRCIPGYEENLKGLVMGLSRQCKVVLHQGEAAKLGLDLTSNNNTAEQFTHVSGHGQQEDMRRAIAVLRPKMVVPFHAPPERVEMFERLFGNMTQIRRLAAGQTLEI